MEGPDLWEPEGAPKTSPNEFPYSVNEPSVSRNYITSLDGLQSTVAGQARQLRTTALLKSEADYYNSQDENITQEKWLAMSEDERQAVRDANKGRIQGARSAGELSQ